MKLYPPLGYFLCECHDFRCSEPVAISGEEYSALLPNTFVVADACAYAPDAPIIEQRNGYTVREGARFVDFQKAPPPRKAEILPFRRPTQK
jgi:hypothetical protein